MPKNTEYGYGYNVSDIAQDDKIYLQLNNIEEDSSPILDSVNKYLYDYNELKDCIASNSYESMEYTDLNLNVMVDNELKELSRQDKINILIKLLKEVRPELPYNAYGEIVENPVDLNARQLKLYKMLYTNVFQNQVLQKPSREVLKLLYLLSCFSHFAQLYFLGGEDLPRASTVLNFNFLNDEATTLANYYMLSFTLFTEENKEKFLQMKFIPKRYSMPTIEGWWKKYIAFDSVATCNGTNRKAFYKMYRNYTKIFYPEEPLKNFSIRDCEFTKLTDFLKGLGEINQDELTFEEIADEATIKRFNDSYTLDSEEGVNIEDDKLTDMEFRKKYLKYKQKYMQLKKR